MPHKAANANFCFRDDVDEVDVLVSSFGAGGSVAESASCTSRPPEGFFSAAALAAQHQPGYLLERSSPSSHQAALKISTAQLIWQKTARNLRLHLHANVSKEPPARNAAAFTHQPAQVRATIFAGDSATQKLKTTGC